MKHRKGAGTGSGGSVVGPHRPRRSPPAHRGAPSSSKRPHGSARCRSIATFAPGLVLLALMLVWIKSPPAQSPALRSFPPRPRVADDTHRTVLSMPYHALRHRLGDKAAADYGATPLVGTHSLSNPGHVEHDARGFVQYPSLDLSSDLPEEAAQGGGGFLRQGGGAGPPLEESAPESFLAEDGSMKIYSGVGYSASPDRALLTRRGYKDLGKSPNQDRSFIARFSFHDPPHGSDSAGKRAQTRTEGRMGLLMGLFDGHGDRGHLVSHYAALELPHMLIETLRRNLTPNDNFIEWALTEAFSKVDGSPSRAREGALRASSTIPGEGRKCTWPTWAIRRP